MQNSAAQIAVKTIANEIDIAAKENKKDTLTALIRILKTLAQQDSFRMDIDRFTLGKFSASTLTRKLIQESWFSALSTFDWNLSPSEKNLLTKQLRRFDFDVFGHDEANLVRYLDVLFEYEGFNSLSIDKTKLRNFLLAIKARYGETIPYHNFKHAFDVIQTAFSIVTNGGAQKYISPVETLALLVASYCHDVGHPGFNNIFQVSTSSSLAKQFNDQSPLENYHCWLTFEVLEVEENNFIASWSPEERKTFRRVVVACILATDMAHHAELCSKWNELIPNFKQEDETHRIMLLKMILKCSDISNPTKSFELAKKWGQAISTEFWNQGDKEKELKIPVTKGMDRETTQNYAVNQLGFTDFVLTPLFQALHKFLPDVKPLVEQLEKNKPHWMQLKEELTH